MGAYRELLAQAKKANHTAIQKLYERYYTLLRSYSFVNGRFDEDLFQTQVIEFLIAAIICVVLDLLLLVRVLNGPTAVDRLCAIDCMSVVTALGLSAYTVFTGRIIYLDIALVDAILGFISTVFVSRYLEGRL